MSASAVDTVSPADIPVIDIAALADPGSDVALAVARRLCAAYEHLGFAYVAGHGVPQALADACMAQSVAFHAATPEQKRSVAINRFHRGYMTFASSTVVTSTIARNRHPNLSESFLVMHDLAPDDPDLLAGKPLQGPNQWPDWLPGFKPAVLAYMAAVEGVARRLLHAFCAGLALPRDALDPLFARPTVFLRLLHYPPHP
ncbi:MAG: isopenicillin N synthase family oxygenase, partial [Alphaproteobacteria bacterium]|nr:isopenicillin N synthase family oxygenase [Alphaproteobacteria bacterium]